MENGVLQPTREFISPVPVSAVFHAGAVLKDGVLVRQNPGSLRSVYVPKVVGAANLGAATWRQPVTQTVYFSSLSAQLGTPGQSNYAAANAALDAHAQHATNSGLAVGSVMWGPWASGMALREPALLQRFQKAGLGAITADDGLGLLSCLLGMLGSHSAAAVVGASIQWARLLQGRTKVPGIFAEFAQAAPKRARRSIVLSVDARSPPHIGPLLVPQHERVAPIKEEINFLQVVGDAVRGLLGHDITAEQPLMEAGLDSLGELHILIKFLFNYNISRLWLAIPYFIFNTLPSYFAGAVELRNVLQSQVGEDLPATLTFDYPSVAALAGFLAARATVSTQQASTEQNGAQAQNTAASHQFIESRLQGIVAELLGAEISAQQPLMEAGLDSLGAVELRDRVATAFNTEVPATLTFDYPSVAAMAQYLLQYHSSTTGTAVTSNGTALLPYSTSTHLSSNAADDLQEKTLAGSEISAISCRYPGAATAGNDPGDGFWKSFCGSAELQSVVPFDRWDMERAYSPDMGADNMRFYARFAAFCTGVQLFDAAAFRLTAQEAAAMDPQIRMLMQEAAEATSVAGILGNEALKGASGSVVGLSVGVYVGCMYHEHLDVVTSSTTKLSPQAIVGNGAPYMVGRLSYTFGFSGTPS